ncbi:MAG TPA: PAC2 family protein [Candidatus Bathyarchaeia archaeon]|nr:PAC2 family protein [Candidatus Bathyarchaeia archaeon]
MTVRVLVEKKKLKGSTLVTGFHGVGQTGYIATSYMIHALKADRIGFIEVANPPPWVGTADGGLVTPFEIYSKRKTVLVKLEFSPHRSEEAEFAKVLADWAVEEKFKDAILVGGLDIAFKNNKHDFAVVPTGAYLDRAKIFKAPILEPGLLVYGPLAIMLNEFEIHDFPAVAVLPYAEPARADPAAAALAIRKIAKAYNFRVEVDELVKDAKFIEREWDQKSRLTRKSLHRMYA